MSDLDEKCIVCDFQKGYHSYEGEYCPLGFSEPGFRTTTFTARVESPTKEEQTPLSALRNKLGPFVNLVRMMRQEEVTMAYYIETELGRCDIEGLNELLNKQ